MIEQDNDKNEFGMKEDKTTQYRIQIDKDLFDYLHPESGEKYSKMAAFRNLVEIAIGDKKEFPAIAKPLPVGQVALTVSGLAKHWNWHRTTVRKFLSELERLGGVKVTGRSGYFLLTMVCLLPDGEQTCAPLLSEEELLLNRWLCGYLTIEESVEMLAHFITETDKQFVAEPTGKHPGRQPSTGERLHKLVAHIILQRTGIIPADERVNEALEHLFLDECDKDLARFLERLTLAGLRLIENGKPKDAQATCSGDETIGIILRHYLPFITQENPVLRAETARGNSTNEQT